MAEQHEKALVPQIRFTGFTDPWEQRKLGDCGSAYGGLSGKTKEDFGRGTAKFVPYTNVFDNPITDSNRLESIEKDSKQNEVRYGDALFTVSSETPGEVGMSSVWLSDQPNVYLNSFCFGYRQDGSFDSRYLAYMLRSQNVRSDLTLLAQGISRFNISKNKVMELKVPYPRLKEQAQLGSFFDHLDSLITLHQRKYDKLCVLKKSMLDKMFPKGGSLYPEIRFAGFTDPWEQRKLGQHLKLSRELGHTGVDARKLTVKLWGKGVVEKTDLYGGSAQTQYYIRHAGQFMYGKLDFLHAAFGVVPDKLDCFESTLDSPAFDIEGLDSSFLLNLVTQEDFYLKNGNIANGSRKAKRIHEETFLNMEIRAPELVEQRRIGAFLDRLDSLITLHQRKLELLRNIKKSMLDKMFV